MTRTDLLNIITHYLRQIDGGISTIPDAISNQPYRFESNVHGNVHPRFLYLEEINDFPCICTYAIEEQFRELEAGIRYRIMSVHIRGYVYGEHDESYNSVWSAETLLDDIEHVLSSLSRLEPCVIDARFISLSTDQGFLAPYGVADAIFQITYESVDD